MARKSFQQAVATTPDPNDLNGLLIREAEGDKPDLLKMAALINAGADVNARNGKQRTVLMLAVFAQNKDAAALLIDKGADMYARDNGTPSADAMFMALARYDRDMVAMLLDKKFDPNRAPCHGTMTALMWAANLHKMDLCEELATRGADIHAKNPKNGWTAMEYAKENLKPHIADRLLRIDEQNKARAAIAAAEAKLKAELAARAAAKAELDAICDAGIPAQNAVKVMRPIVYMKPPR